jgi:hypothetical protein
LSLLGISPAQRDDPGLRAAGSEYEHVYASVDHAKSAISDLAVVLPVIDRDHRRVEFEVLDNCKIDTVFAQIGRAFVFVPGETPGARRASDRRQDIISRLLFCSYRTPRRGEVAQAGGP